MAPNTCMMVTQQKDYVRLINLKEYILMYITYMLVPQLFPFISICGFNYQHGGTPCIPLQDRLGPRIALHQLHHYHLQGFLVHLLKSDI